MERAMFTGAYAATTMSAAPAESGTVTNDYKQAVYGSNESKIPLNETRTGFPLRLTSVSEAERIARSLRQVAASPLRRAAQRRSNFSTMWFGRLLLML
jgi:hypothetical protein